MSSINNKNPPLPPTTLTPAQADEYAKNAAANPGTLRPPSKVEQQQAERAAEQAPPKKNSAAENERLLSQSGFARVGKRRGRGFELDDGGAQAPIPLPVDDVDESAWEQRGLDDAQQELTLQGAQLKQLAQEIEAGGVDAGGLIGGLMGHTFSPTAEDVARLQALSDQQAPATDVALGTVSQSLQQHFGLQLQDIPTGPAMVAAALVVAGLGDAVQPQAGELAPKALCVGMQKLVDSSNDAVQDARGMSDGITKQLALHRTFMFKR